MFKPFLRKFIYGSPETCHMRFARTHLWSNFVNFWGIVWWFGKPFGSFICVCATDKLILLENASKSCQVSHTENYQWSVSRAVKEVIWLDNIMRQTAPQVFPQLYIYRIQLKSILKFSLDKYKQTQRLLKDLQYDQLACNSWTSLYFSK